MRTRDLVAGARHWWGLDRAEHLAVLVWYALVAGAVVIAGGPLWLVGVSPLPPLVVIGVGIWRRARDHREYVELYEWLTLDDPLTDLERELLATEQLPETD